MAGLERKDIKALRDAIYSVYPNHDRFEMFIALDVDSEQLCASDRSEIKIAIFRLIQQAESIGETEKLLIGLRDASEVEKREDIQQLCDDLLFKLQPTVDQEKLSIAKPDLNSLFQQFDAAIDFPYIQIAFYSAFQTVFARSFFEMRPDRPSTNSLAAIRRLLEIYSAELAIRFAEYALEELSRSPLGMGRQNSQSFFQAIDDWRQRMANEFGITSPLPKKIPQDSQGYLLVAFDAPRPDLSDISMTAELYRGEEAYFGQPDAPQYCCKIEEAANRLSQWILSATEKLAAQNCKLDCIELFLPCHHIESLTDVADDWEVHNLQGRSRPFGSRNYIIRSLERAAQEPTQVCLAKNWVQLEQCKNKDVCDHFHLQRDCPKVGDLEGLEASGLNLVADLSSNKGERQEILFDIINSGVPITFWFGPNNQQTSEKRLKSLKDALKDVDLTNFVGLAQAWRTIRARANVRLLVDCPHRRPSLPDPENREDDDSLVSETLSP
ncbi:effector-associated domain EAD1-containing protein [Sphaerothrix gracilis]|uniref:VMAP-C domain-containing protein n=1 Tax=Sphaerothrix gracilis TaxID=3151835 RepID=UPI0031FE1A90